jgi:transformation/transcription domain-associated protein
VFCRGTVVSSTNKTGLKKQTKNVRNVDLCIFHALLRAFQNILPILFIQVNETPGSPGELLSRRCVSLLKPALRPDFWPNAELKLAWFDKLLTSVENHQPNFNNICTALELLGFLLQILVSRS